MKNLEQLNIDIRSYLLHRPDAVFTPFYVSNTPECRSDSMLLLSELGATGYYLILQKVTEKWFFSMWKVDGADFTSCAVHGNTIEEVLYEAMVILVHQAMEKKNV